MKILLKNIIISRKINSIIKNNVLGLGSILIENELITKVYKENETILETYDKLIDGKKKLHAFIDLADIHVHFRTPGYEYKEDINSGSAAAARGGFNHVVCMANTKPVIDNKVSLDTLNNIIKKESLINVYPVGAVTKELKGLEIASPSDLVKGGIIAFSDDGYGINDEDILYTAYKNTAKYNLPIMLHCQDNEIDPYNRNSEIKSIKLSIKVLKRVPKAKVHIQHVSTKEGIDLIITAKNKGLNITFETCPHYLTLTSNDLKKYQGRAIMNPPLKLKDDRDYSIKMLKQNTIDILATDHAPHLDSEKTGDKIMNGIIGLESSIPIVGKVINDSSKMIDILLNQMSKNPCKLVNIPYNSTTANITLIDLEAKYKLDISKFVSKARNCPFNNWDVKGRVITTICKGKIVYQYKKEGEKV